MYITVHLDINILYIAKFKAIKFVIVRDIQTD